MRELALIFRRQWRLTYRNFNQISATVLYLVSSMFIAYLGLHELKGNQWVILYWIIFLFATIQAGSQLSQQLLGPVQSYYYQLSEGTNWLLAKTIFGFVLFVILGLLLWFLFSLFFGNIVKQPGYFLLTIFLFSLGLSVIINFLSMISGRTDNSNALLAVISFPMIIPVILQTLKLSLWTIAPDNMTVGISSDILILLALDLLFIGVSMFLIPYIWCD